MKSKEEWAACCHMETSDDNFLNFIAAVQADAIRWAANLTGVLSRITALDKADELDPPPPKQPL